jgi:hypothetical protein
MERRRARYGEIGSRAYINDTSDTHSKPKQEARVATL